MGLSLAASSTAVQSGNHRILPSTIESLEPRRLLSTASFLSPVVTTFPANTATTVEGNLIAGGTPDVVAAYANGTAQVFLGTSSGTLTGGQVLSTGGTVEALGKFTASGNLDLATAAGVFPGSGNGTFGTVIGGLSLPTNTVALYGEDVNGDGKLDLVAGIFTPAAGQSLPSISIAVMLGNGDGTFGAATITPVGAAPGMTANYAQNFVFGDFNNDGHLDVVTPFGIMLGNGTPTFRAPAALPGTTSPTAPFIAEGDFNGDHNLDLAIEPDGISSPNSGNVQILLGTGTGTFTVGSVINLGDGGVSALTAADVNGDGTPDLIAGVGASSGTPAVAVMLDTGAGTFQTPTVIATGGVPINLFTGDFNTDGKPDVLAINAATGIFPGTGVAQGASAAVMINTSAVPVSATVTLTTSANPTIINVPVQFTATVTGPLNAATPTGTVTFFDATTSLGTATVSSTGIAKFSATFTTAGQHAITADYSGDANFDASNSASLTQRVLQTSAKTPLVLPAIPTLTIPSVAIAGDKGTVDLTINNVGGAAANGKVAAAFYLSADAAIDNSAVPITVKPSNKIPVHMGIGGAATSAFKFTVPALPAGTYSVLVQLTAISGLTSDQVATTVAASPITFQSLGYAFGTVGIHKNVKTTTVDALGNSATLSLAGPGTGVVTTTGNQTTITVTGTTGASAITIVSRGGSFTFNAMTVSGALKSLTAKTATDAGTLTIGAGANVAISLGTGDGGVLDSSAPITTLAVGNWTAGQIIAPSIGTLNVSGDISADVFTHGGGIGSTKIGGIAGGTWAIAQNIGTLKVLGSISDAEILAGDDAGPDNILGTSDDIYSAATIGSIAIFGADTSSTIGAGAVPSNGSFQFLPNSAIRSIVVKGAVSTDARFLAFTLPTTASLAGTTVNTATDPHFET